MILEFVRSLDTNISRHRLRKQHSHVVIFFILVALFTNACDSNRMYERNEEFEDRTWKIASPAHFEFDVADTTKACRLFLNVRNSLEYPYARLFVNYQLVDPVGNVIDKNMISENLFDVKTGEPLGRSGLGDVHDHRFQFLNKHFKKAGKYKMTFSQFMRQDTLQGVLAVGLRIENEQ